ncbi:hypothetical protein OIO90_000277 [Microbotryomycetes sp. JL221]|nr:hypothetical protein OIO90_000277 [Microbotryomycetes sp. JL221]
MPPKGGNKAGSQPQQPQQRLKVVVRRLPADLPEAVFWKSVAPWVIRHDDSSNESQAQAQPGAEKVAWCQYKPGKVRKNKQDKDDVASRAYITFRTPESLVAFHRSYDGWTFRDKTGHTSQALVEFAPFQRSPLVAVKPDPRQGTIDDDPDYIAFKEALEAPTPAETSNPDVLAPLDPKSTPLLEHLRAQRAAEKAAKKAKKKVNSAASTVDDPRKGAKKARGAKAEKLAGPAAARSKLAQTASAISAEAVPSSDALGKKSRSRTKNKDKANGPGKATIPLTATSGPASVATSVPSTASIASAGSGQTASSSTNKAQQQADMMRKALQAQHHNSQTGGSGTTPAMAPAPKILMRNPDRPTALAPTSSNSSVGSATSAPAPAPSSSVANSKPSRDIAAQRRQLGAAIGAAIGDSRGRGRGRSAGTNSGSGRGGGASSGARGGGAAQTTQNHTQSAANTGTQSDRGRGGFRGRGRGRGGAQLTPNSNGAAP